MEKKYINYILLGLFLLFISLSFIFVKYRPWLFFAALLSLSFLIYSSLTTKQIKNKLEIDVKNTEQKSNIGLEQKSEQIKDQQELLKWRNVAIINSLQKILSDRSCVGCLTFLNGMQLPESERCKECKEYLEGELDKIIKEITFRDNKNDEYLTELRNSLKTFKKQYFEAVDKLKERIPLKIPFIKNKEGESLELPLTSTELLIGVAMVGIIFLIWQYFATYRKGQISSANIQPQIIPQGGIRYPTGQIYYPTGLGTQQTTQPQPVNPLAPIIKQFEDIPYQLVKQVQPIQY